MTTSSAAVKTLCLASTGVWNIDKDFHARNANTFWFCSCVAESFLMLGAAQTHCVTVQMVWMGQDARIALSHPHYSWRTGHRQTRAPDSTVTEVANLKWNQGGSGSLHRTQGLRLRVEAISDSLLLFKSRCVVSSWEKPGGCWFGPYTTVVN